MKDWRKGKEFTAWVDWRKLGYLRIHSYKIWPLVRTTPRKVEVTSKKWQIFFLSLILPKWFFFRQVIKPAAALLRRYGIYTEQILPQLPYRARFHGKRAEPHVTFESYVSHVFKVNSAQTIALAPVKYVRFLRKPVRGSVPTYHTDVSHGSHVVQPNCLI